MRTGLAFIIVMGMIPILIQAANDNYPFGGRAAGMGNAAVSLYDFWAVSHNQAGLARLQNMAAGVYFENRFLIEELSFGAGAFAYPTPSGVVAFSFTYFGFDLYNESKMGLAYSRDFGERFSAGLQLNYHHVSIAGDYGSKGGITFEAGVIYQILPELSIGTHLFNPTRTKTADFANERIPTIFRTGLSYTFSEKVIVVAEAEKSVNYPVVFRAGVEYRLIESVSVRGGIGTRPTTNAFGFGLEWGNLMIDIAASFHHVLGYSPQLSFVYEFR